MASNVPEQDGHCELAVPSNPLITHRRGPYRRGISPRRNMRRKRQPGPCVRLARLVEKALQIRGSGSGCREEGSDELELALGLLRVITGVHAIVLALDIVICAQQLLKRLPRKKTQRELHLPMQ